MLQTLTAVAEIPVKEKTNSLQRTAVYALLLTAMAAAVYFVNLGSPTMYADEAQYALCVDHAMQNGDWISFSPYPPAPYFQKPPMYFWLTGLTYRFFGDGVVRYRFWSALMGVGCVTLTCVLGAMLISPEVGLLAGLLLLTNRYFQNDHGARTGSMDTAITLCTLSCFIFYWMRRQGRAGRWTWIAIGIMVGLASLFKQAAGAPALLILALHALWLDRKTERAERPLRGLLVALVIALLVASPYYLVSWSRNGSRIFHVMFKQAIVDTVTTGDPGTHEHLFREADRDPVVAKIFAGQPWYTLIHDMHRSSVPFALAEVGIVFAIVCSWKGKNRGAYALLALTAVIYLAIFSTSVVRRVRYAYPAFPEISIAMAASWAAAINGVLSFKGRRPAVAEFAGPFGIICVALIVMEAVDFGHNQLTGERCGFEAWNIYQTFRPAIRDGHARLVFYGLPNTQFQWRKTMGLDAADCFYLEHMPEAESVNDPQDVQRLLATVQPTILIESRFASAGLADSVPDIARRSDDRFEYHHRAFEVRGIDLGSLLEPHLAPGKSSPYIQLLDSKGQPLSASKAGFAFTDGFIVRLTPPLRADTWLTLRLAKPDTAADLAVRYHGMLKENLLDWGKLEPLSRQPRILLRINKNSWAKNGPTDVAVQLIAAEAGKPGQAISAEVSEASLSVRPMPAFDR